MHSFPHAQPSPRGAQYVVTKLCDACVCDHAYDPDVCHRHTPNTCPVCVCCSCTYALYVGRVRVPQIGCATRALGLCCDTHPPFQSDTINSSPRYSQSASHHRIMMVFERATKFAQLYARGVLACAKFCAHASTHNKRSTKTPSCCA